LIKSSAQKRHSSSHKNCPDLQRLPTNYDCVPGQDESYSFGLEEEINTTYILLKDMMEDVMKDRG
jgi:hypothetical protein